MARCPPQLTSGEVARFGRDVDQFLFKAYSRMTAKAARA
jgi:hypothetical protein